MALAAVFLAALGPVGVGQAQETTPFSSTPRSGPPGTVITNSGECRGGVVAGVTLVRAGSRELTANAVTRPDANGSWRVRLRVAGHTPPGNYVLEAVCGFGRGTPNIYRPNNFTVTPVPKPRTAARPILAQPRLTG